MSPLQQINVIKVGFFRGNIAIPMGRLALQNRRVIFEYTSSFLETGLELSPFKLPLKPGVQICEEYVFDGLFGIFNDSLPDGWGRLLLDRRLMKHGINPQSLTPLDRLRYVGRRGLGALYYEPVIDDVSSYNIPKDLDFIADECLQIQEHDEDQYIDDLFIMNGSSAGARPKILVSIIKNKFELTTNALNSTHNDWIIKFRSSTDPKDIGSIEFAYHLMALEAGLDVPDARLFKSKKCPGFYGVKRFDREQDNFFHMHTMSGLLHADHRMPSLDYQTLMKATLWLTKDMRECEKQFRNVVFNVFSHNRDDHAKNFCFLMQPNGEWKVSPAFDLTFSSGPAGEHCTSVMGEGKNPGTSHLLKLATVTSIKPERAIEIIDQVKHAISKWKDFATSSNVTLKSSSTIQTMLNQVLKNP